MENGCTTDSEERSQRILDFCESMEEEDIILVHGSIVCMYTRIVPSPIGLVVAIIIMMKVDAFLVETLDKVFFKLITKN